MYEEMHPTQCCREAISPIDLLAMIIDDMRKETAHQSLRISRTSAF